MSRPPSDTQNIRTGGGPRGPGAMHGIRIEKAKDTRGTLKRLATYFAPFRRQLALVAVLIVVGTALNVMGPFLIGRAVDAFGDRTALVRVSTIMLAAFVVQWLAQFGQNYLTAAIVQQALRSLRQDLFEHLQMLSLRFFDRQTHGELMSRLTSDTEAINRALIMGVTQLISGLLSLAGILAMMALLNVWLTLGSLLVIPLMLLLTGSVAKHTRQSFRDLQSRLGQLNGMMEETISAQRVVQAFGQERTVLASFVRANKAVRQSGIRAMTLAYLVMPMMTVLSNAHIAVVAGLGGWLVLRGMASVGMVVSFVNYARRFAEPLRQLSSLYNSVQAAIAGAERVFAVIDERPELTDKPDALSLEKVCGEAAFDQVDFGYDKSVPVLEDVTFIAQPGQTIALVGPTGAGKTTIVNLLMRFYDVDSGAIRIDGHDLRSLRKDSLRRKMGMVLQDTFLFSDTVMENIRYGRLDATDEECMAAARLANAEQFILRLPHGYQTELSERAGNLSQGQRQLLSIARAALSDPAILILDEATSSVDTRTEVRIQQALLRLMQGKTSFVIAHRLSTIRKADLVLVINGGRIIESGNHEQLVARRGFYYNLYMSQFKGTGLQETELAPAQAIKEAVARA